MGFKRLEADDFVVSAQAQTQLAGQIMYLHLTEVCSHNQTKLMVRSGKYYTTVFNTLIRSSNCEAQFEIAYGNQHGGGALAFNQTAAPWCITSIYNLWSI